MVVEPGMVPFLNLKLAHEPLIPEIEAAIRSTIEGAQFVLGESVLQFEGNFARFLGAKEAIGVNSGTSALHLALLALGIGPGDEVITAPHTFVATVWAIRYTGARAVLVDSDDARFTIDPAKLQAAITPRTKAIMPVHLFGQCADMDPILEIAGRHRIPVVEDAAQAHGATYKSRSAGTIGVIGCFSFYAAKNIGAFGEGGAVVTADPELAHKVRAMRDWGQSSKNVHVLPGYNYRMEGIQGAVLDVKLKYLADWNAQRRTAAALYDRLLSERIDPTAVRAPAPCPDGDHVYHLYVVRLAERDRVRAALEKAGVQTGIHYPKAVHRQPVFRDLGYAEGDLPIAEKATAEILSLPMFPGITPAEIEEVVDALADVLGKA